MIARLTEALGRIRSRKFLLAIAGIVYVIAQVNAGTLTAAEGTDAIRTIVLGYLAAEGIGDAAGRYGAARAGTAGAGQ